MKTPNVNAVGGWERGKVRATYSEMLTLNDSLWLRQERRTPRIPAGSEAKSERPTCKEAEDTMLPVLQHPIKTDKHDATFMSSYAVNDFTSCLWDKNRIQMSQKNPLRSLLVCRGFYRVLKFANDVIWASRWKLLHSQPYRCHVIQASL